MNIAFVYAGQGSQKENMGYDLYEQYDVFKEAFDNVDCNGKLKKLCFQSDLEILSDTRNTQPAMVAFAHGVTEILKDNDIKPNMVAGLSLGEYSALAAAEVIDGKTAVELVTYRGDIMAQEVEGMDSKMVAVLKLHREKLEELCKEGSKYGIVEISNYNCPGQQVFAGESKAVDRVTQLCMDNGAKRCMALNVSGPFHTSLLKSAGDKLGQKLKYINFKHPKIPVIFNCTGKSLNKDDSVNEIKKLLERQVQSSVYFEDSIRYMIARDIDTIIEIGPGRVLSGFVKKIDPNIKTYAVDDCESMENLLKDWREIHGK